MKLNYVNMIIQDINIYQDLYHDLSKQKVNTYTDRKPYHLKRSYCKTADYYCNL